LNMMNFELPVVPNNVTCVSSNLTALSLCVYLCRRKPLPWLYGSKATLEQYMGWC
jgi:hypothetical protein